MPRAQLQIHFRKIFNFYEFADKILYALVGGVKNPGIIYDRSCCKHNIGDLLTFSGGGIAPSKFSQGWIRKFSMTHFCKLCGGQNIVFNDPPGRPQFTQFLLVKFFRNRYKQFTYTHSRQQDFTSFLFDKLKQGARQFNEIWIS